VVSVRSNLVNQILCKEALKSLPGLELKIIRRKGRFPEEETLEYLLGYSGVFHRLLVIKFFKGRPPFYRRWVEVFSIRPHIVFNSKTYTFINSDEEEKLIKCLSDLINPGERLFIEYVYDVETWKALEVGIPPPLTRLGYILLKNGFTWFKDWYFPEGFMEGGPKLQVEKPLDEEARIRHLIEICNTAKEYVEKLKNFSLNNPYLEIRVKAMQRAENILVTLCKDYNNVHK